MKYNGRSNNIPKLIWSSSTNDSTLSRRDTDTILKKSKATSCKTKGSTLKGLLLPSNTKQTLKSSKGFYMTNRPKFKYRRMKWLAKKSTSSFNMKPLKEIERKPTGGYSKVRNTKKWWKGSSRIYKTYKVNLDWWCRCNQSKNGKLPFHHFLVYCVW